MDQLKECVSIMDGVHDTGSNKGVVQKWSSDFSNLVNNGQTDDVGDFAGNAVTNIESSFNPVKGDADIWMPVLLALLQHPTRQAVRAVQRTLSDGKFKKIWDWKKNLKYAEQIIEIISKNKNLPTNEDDDGVIGEYASVLTELFRQLGIVKVADKLAYEAMDLCMTMLERRSEIINGIPRSIIFDIPNLEKCRDKVEGLAKRFKVILTDKKYPWIQSTTDYAAASFLGKLVRSHSKGSMVSKNVNEIMISIFKYCLDEDVSYDELGEATIYGQILNQPMYAFVNLHNYSDTHAVLKPLVPYIFKMLEDDDLKASAGNMLYGKPEMFVDCLDNVIHLYKSTQEMAPLNILFQVFQHPPFGRKDLKCNFEEFYRACVDDPDNLQMQTIIMWTVANKMPEVFTEEMITFLLTDCFEAQYHGVMVVRALQDISEDFPERIPYRLAVQRVFHEVDIGVDFLNYVAKFASNMAKINEEYATEMTKELIGLLKKLSDTGSIWIVSLIDALKTIAHHDMDKVKPYQPYIEKLRRSGSTSDIQEAAVKLIDILEGRSLEVVETDIKTTKKEVIIVDKKVEKTTKEIGVVQGDIEKNTKGVALVNVGVLGVNERIDDVEEDLGQTNVKVEEIDKKTISNVPVWSHDITKLLNKRTENDWRSLANRLDYSSDQIEDWGKLRDPCMGLLSDLYAKNKTLDATEAVLTALQDMNREDAAVIVENAMKNVDGIVEQAPDYETPPPIFLSYQWGLQREVKLLRDYLQMAGYECWMDIGQMGGGEQLFERIDSGIRGARIVLCCVSEKYAKSPNCNREVNLAVNIGKPMIPLLMEKMSWPPAGGMGPIFGEYLFIRFFQRGGEETNDLRYWPEPKFNELLMQVNLEVAPNDAQVTNEYKEWWKPLAKDAIVVHKKRKHVVPEPKQETGSGTPPEVFISYQWGKQPQVKRLYERLTDLGLSCWMDIHQMGGGDSLYDKIDVGVRGCKVVLSCVTSKYALSANCRREVSLADSVKKTIIPLLLEDMEWPPSGPMGPIFKHLMYSNFGEDLSIQMSWEGEKFNAFLSRIYENGVGDKPMSEHGVNGDTGRTTPKEDGETEDLGSERTNVPPRREEQESEELMLKSDKTVSKTRQLETDYSSSEVLPKENDATEDLGSERTNVTPTREQHERKNPPPPAEHISERRAPRTQHSVTESVPKQPAPSPQSNTPESAPKQTSPEPAKKSSTCEIL